MSSDKFLRGAMILTLAGLMVKVIGSVNRILLSRLLGGEGIGLYQMAYPVYLLLLAISAAGIPVAISIIVAGFLAQKDYANVRQVFRVSLRLMACVGAVLGTSTTTTFVESASGVTEGGRTGLTAMTTGVLFLLATIFSPLFLTIPSFATAPALIIVGFYMMGSAIKIDFNDPSEGIPAFLTILAMPTAYSISEGIAIGIISWTIINVITGKAKEKKISPLMYVLTVLFILKYVCL